MNSNLLQKNAKHVNEDSGRREVEHSQQVAATKSSTEIPDSVGASGRTENTHQSRIKENEVYKYFTNSAHEENDARSNRFPEAQNMKESYQSNPKSTADQYRTYPLRTGELCDSCRSDAELGLCRFCQQCRSMFPNQLSAIAMPMICESCSAQPTCLCCGERICMRCKRPTKSNSVSPRRSRRIDESPPLNRAVEKVESNKSDDFNSRLVSEAPKSQPFSSSIGSKSVPHPSHSRAEKKLSISVKNDEVSVEQDDVSDLKRLTNEKLSKYAKNYGDMRARAIPRDQSAELDSYPLPLIPPELNLSSRYSRDENSAENSLAFKQLEARWKVKAQ